MRSLDLPKHPEASIGRESDRGRWYGPATAGAVLVVAALAALLGAGLRLDSGTPGILALSPWIRLDALSLPVVGMMLLIGTTIFLYASNYLAGNPGRSRFRFWFLCALASVSLLVVSNHLLVLIAARFASSQCLYRLLLFYPERPRARMSAHKQFLVSGIADLCLLGAAALLWSRYGTLHLDGLFAARLAEGAASAPALEIATVLLATASILQCAQLPVHGWLLQVMEAPTPVSALLHAGIVNVGGFLLIRCAPLFADAALAQGLLVTIGGITAAVAGLVMLTRISIKVMLAWSTCAQMGFMLVECGLGLWSLALLHLMAHSFYKAHAFLSSGQAVEHCVARRMAPADAAPRKRTWGLAVLIVLLGLAAAAAALGVSHLRHPEEAALLAILSCTLVILIAEALTGISRRVALALLVIAASLVGLHLGLHRAFTELLRPLLPESATSWSAAGFVIALFAALTALHATIRSAPGGVVARRLFPLFYGGLFLDELSTRITLRVWPTRFTQHPSHAIHTTNAAASGSVPIQDVSAMSAPDEPPSVDFDRFEAAVRAVCALQTPIWPLDRAIAVNPFWEQRGERFEDVAGRLADRSGAHLLPRADHLRPLVERSILEQSHLDRAAAELDLPAPTLNELNALDEPLPSPLALWTHWLDAQRDLDHEMSWEEEVTHQISQFCAAWFDRGQSRWSPATEPSLYSAWHTAATGDHGLSLLMGTAAATTALARLPRTADELFREAARVLALPEDELVRYLHAVMTSINGWASICALIRWERQRPGKDDERLRDVLAIRLGWELTLMQGVAAPAAAAAWREALGRGARREERFRRALSAARVWQRAAELAYQEPLARALGRRAGGDDSRRRAEVQAAFCIDVRSEVYRRALETENEGISTLGFAGFFGLPIAVQELGSEVVRPQLPGLLAPSLLVREHPTGDESEEVAVARVRERGSRSERWHMGSAAAPAGFSVVECFGLAYAGKLLGASILGMTPRSAESPGTRPHLAAEIGGREGVSLERRIELAAGILRGLFQGDAAAPLVLLVGHGSSNVNNPGAAALDCGACCGRPGLINARVAATLLNDPDVRLGLAERGRPLPSDTRFVAGLHDTTTDAVTLHDLDLLPDSHRPLVDRLRGKLEAASARARAERARSLGLRIEDPSALERALRKRARDWSEVRPEWGLVNNAALVIGPRERTRGLDLEGRVFLHEYRWREDENFSVLEGLMTAPMLVAHWINLQYYASTVDPVRYGSGHKVIHNVVGGSLGVFAGNGGDLRIGLARESLHDGERWRHAPLRLSVFIAAPRAAIEAVVARHATVRDLVDNEWLHLFHLDDESPTVARLRHGAWTDFGTDAPDPGDDSPPGPGDV
ncbi:MAG: NADH-quinone oxidoreductase subunit L [Planctomycetota bacterium]